MRLALYSEGLFVAEVSSCAEKPPAMVVYEGVEYWIVSTVGKKAALYERLSVRMRASGLAERMDHLWPDAATEKEPTT